MCIKRSGDNIYQYKCTIIGITSLILHTLLLCYAIETLTVAVNRSTTNSIHDDLKHDTKVYFGKFDKKQFFGLYGTITAFSILGIVSSVMLIIGSKYRKPGYIIVFICYSLTLTILLLISGILMILSLQWMLAIGTLCLFGLSCNVTMTVNRSYEDMVQDGLLACQNSISDLTLLIEDDPSNDLISVPEQ